MDSELIIRTTKPSYSGGDTVYGAVYLKISSPTSAFGVCLKFCGCETVSEKEVTTKLHVSEPVETAYCNEECTRYLPSDNIIIHDFSGPVPLGSYVLPFCKQLPLDLPGSTELIWNCIRAEIVYRVEASLLGADHCMTYQRLVIKQPTLSSLFDNNQSRVDDSSCKLPSVTLDCEVPTFVPFLSSRIAISVSLDKSEYITGENLKLKLDMTVNSSVKPRISYLNFQLLRHTQLASDLVQNSITSVNSDCQNSSSSLRRNLVNSEVLCGDQTVVVWDSGRVYDRDGSLCHKGFNELLIPLKDADGFALPATTKGHRFMLLYSVHVEIKLDRSDPILLNVPIYCVWQKLVEWQSWKPPDWLFDCQLLSWFKSPYHVCDEILGSTEFSSLPSFQMV